MGGMDIFSIFAFAIIPFECFSNAVQEVQVLLIGSGTINAESFTHSLGHVTGCTRTLAIHLERRSGFERYAVFV